MFYVFGDIYSCVLVLKTITSHLAVSYSSAHINWRCVSQFIEDA